MEFRPLKLGNCIAPISQLCSTCVFNFLNYYNASLLHYPLNGTLDYTWCDMTSEYQFSRTFSCKSCYIFTVIQTITKDEEMVRRSSRTI